MPEKEARPNRRRIVYIHKTFQRNFILKFCLIALCAMVLASVLLYFFSKDSITATYRYHHLALQETAEVILPALIITNLIVLLALLVATVVMTLYVSHRIGGPLYRLQQALESIGRGDLSMDVKLRRHDQLMDFSSNISQMNKNLNDRVRQIQSEVRELKNKTQSNSFKVEEIRKDMENLHQTVHQLFKTE